MTRSVRIQPRTAHPACAVPTYPLCRREAHKRQSEHADEVGLMVGLVQSVSAFWLIWAGKPLARVTSLYLGGCVWVSEDGPSVICSAVCTLGVLVCCDSVEARLVRLKNPVLRLGFFQTVKDFR